MNGYNHYQVRSTKEVEDRDELAMYLTVSSKEEEKVESLSHTYLSLLLGDQQEQVSEEERDEEQQKTADSGDSIKWWSKYGISCIRREKEGVVFEG